MEFYSEARDRGGNFDAGIRVGPRADSGEPVVPLPHREAIRATLRAGAAHTVSDVELASRLSFFLWSSIPDEKLLNAGQRRPASRARACSTRRCAA